MMRFLLSSPLLFIILISCSLKRSNALDGRKSTAIDSHYHTVEISSLLPASVCSHSTFKGSNQRQSTLQVFHSHGPCSHQGRNKTTFTPSLNKVLSDDQARVESIQARINPNKTNSNPTKLKNKKTNLPVQPGLPFSTANYLVTVGLGTPRKTLSLVFDTGSDLTWTQCEPCAGSCYQQKEPIFDPSASTSYSNVSCGSAQCSEVAAATGNRRRRCTGVACIYQIAYGDGSFSVGLFSKDKLTVTANDVFPSFYFGCGQNNQGLYGRIAGLLGFGRNSLSFVSQTEKEYGKYFSYCLPSTSSSTGHLILGKPSGIPKNVRYTPFVSRSEDSTFYFIRIESISVGGRQLGIGESVFTTGGTLIDSGTVVTRLPPAAYSTMSAVFRQLMAKYPSAPAYSIFDTCYDFSGYSTITFPIISFTFSGNVKINLHPLGTLYVFSQARVCLAFAATDDDSDAAIFGNTQQKTFEVVYDVAGGNLGFAPRGCN